MQGGQVLLAMLTPQKHAGDDPLAQSMLSTAAAVRM